jgi:hypothetical protein
MVDKERIQAQAPAEGILKRSDWGDAMTYQEIGFSQARSLISSSPVQFLE